MASSLFGNRQPQNSGLTNRIMGIKNMMKSIQNPQMALENMMNSNPQFRQFVEQNKDKTPEQIAQAYGIDLNTIRQLLQ